jgi:hypothetical protein
MIVTLPFASGQSPTLRLYERDTNTAATSAISGTARSPRSTIYDFDIGSVEVGDYDCDIASPAGFVRLRVTDSDYKLCLEWHELDPAVLSGNVTVSSMVDPASGEIASDIIIGDDYLTANTRSFYWDVDAVTGLSAATATTTFGGKRNETGWLVTGTITDLGGSRWRLTHELPRSATSSLVSGYYAVSVEIKGQSDGAEVTRVMPKKPVFLKYKST